MSAAPLLWAPIPTFSGGSSNQRSRLRDGSLPDISRRARPGEVAPVRLQLIALIQLLTGRAEGAS